MRIVSCSTPIFLPAHLFRGERQQGATNHNPRGRLQTTRFRFVQLYGAAKIESSGKAAFAALHLLA
jgi:hypothetical protein